MGGWRPLLLARLLQTIWGGMAGFFNPDAEASNIRCTGVAETAGCCRPAGRFCTFNEWGRCSRGGERCVA